MISRIGPLVQSGRQLHLTWLHLIGGLLGGLVIGLLAGYAGVILSGFASDAQQFAFAYVIPALLIWSALADLEVSPRLPLQISRQTPGSWSCALGPGPGSFAWGLDLGTGVGTRLTSQAFLVLLASAVLVADVWIAMGVMGLYGLSRSAAVVMAVILSRPAKLAATCNAILVRSSYVMVVVASASALAAITLLTSAR